MDNNFLKDDFREEELFKRFLEKQKDGKSLFESEEVTAYDIVQSETDVEDSVNPADEFYDDYELRSIKDILPVPLADRGECTTLWDRIKYFFAYITDKENARCLSCFLIPGFLALMLLINIVVPAKDMSEKENRALAQFPSLSLNSIKDGSFSKGFEEYISDQFVFRNTFVSAKRQFEVMSGKKENHGIIFGKDGYLIENIADLKFDNVESNFKAIESLAAVKRYNITLAVVPVSYEIMSDKLPKNAYINVYGRLMDAAKTNITAKNITISDVSPILKKNNSDYIYYRSDHHQTAHGSYYLYNALSNSLDYEPYKKSDFKIEKKSDDFLGTMWSNSGFAPTEEDEIYKYTLNKNFTYQVSFPTENKTMNTLYNEAALETKDKYTYYLDGNHGLAEIKSSCGTDRKIAVIKDSYAHSLVPFLANHYSEIYMIDLRYYNGDIFEYLYKSDIKDVLVLYNQSTFMTDTNLSKITEIAKYSPYTSVPDISYGVVPELDKVGNEYFDDAVFVGDSLTLGLSYHSGFNSEFMCLGGLSTKNLDTEPMSNGKTVMDSIASKEHIGKVYIMLGTNESVYQKPEEFVGRYSQFIDNIREHHPDVIIYIQSIMPISEYFANNHDLKNEYITEHNEYLLRLAKEKQCYYIDVNSFFADDNGYLPHDAGGDGVHLSPENYRVMADYLRCHAVNVGGVKKIGEGTAAVFKGGKADTGKIAKTIVDSTEFKDTLSSVGDSLIVSNYGVNTDIVLSASLYVSGGSTAEEVAVFEVDNPANTDKVVECIKNRVENKKKDFENYIPAEMTKLNNPMIVTKGNIVVLCLADNPSEDAIKKAIK